MIAEIAGGVALAGLATWAGFESMWPTMHAYGRSFVGLPPGTRKLALTYDDGPNDPGTLRLLEVLARHNVKATFFVLGRVRRSRSRSIVRAPRRSRTRHRQPQLGPSAADLRLRCGIAKPSRADASSCARRLRCDSDVVSPTLRWPHARGHCKRCGDSALSR